MITASEELEKRICQESRLICERELLVAGSAVRYRLLWHLPQYLVECIRGEERVLLPVGQDPAFAAHALRLLVRGEVTPCTAADVIEDLMYEI